MATVTFPTTLNILCPGDDGDNPEEEGGIDVSIIGNVLRVMAFTHKKEPQDMDHIENVIDPHSMGAEKEQLKIVSAR